MRNSLLMAHFFFTMPEYNTIRPGIRWRQKHSMNGIYDNILTKEEVVSLIHALYVQSSKRDETEHMIEQHFGK
jgi:hypothetical protein